MVFWEGEKKKNKVRHWKCSVQQIGGGIDYIEDRQVGKNGEQLPPNLHETRVYAKVVEVVGEMIGTDKTAMRPPIGHFSELPGIQRVPNRERKQVEAEIFDEEKGEYILRYHEVWLITDDEIPAPYHEDSHDIINFSQPPADGEIDNE